MRRPEFCPRSAGIAASLTATIAIALLLSGCTSPDRSRALGDAGLSGKTIALQVCSTCHGAAGTSVSPAFPNLAGQPPAYLTAQLDAFRNRRRSDSKGHEYMWGMASSLSDAQIAELGAYYAAQPTVAGRSADAATMLAGQKVVEQGDAAKGVPACIACHGAHAEGMLQFPRLAGQHADYLVRQLKVFQQTDGRPDGVVMKAIARSMTDKTMAEVAAYLEAMPPVK